MIRWTVGTHRASWYTDRPSSILDKVQCFIGRVSVMAGLFDMKTFHEWCTILIPMWTPHVHLHQIKQTSIVELCRTMLSLAEYRVNSLKILGKGSFGIVHKASDKNGANVAAKRIDFTAKNKSKLPQVALDLNKLIPLDHQNIVKIFNVLETKSTIWVFMELCKHGDLVDYLQGNQASSPVTNIEKFKLMIDIAKGVEYLHSKNVIHRDIKPNNVLVTGVPAAAKLTDFDCSKFLKEDYLTSVMTTNVGTQAFKAPEFFLRTDDHKLEYHRNIDVYAMGLTFLAMIQDNPSLVPKLETPNDASDLGPLYTIGKLIAERKRYGVKPLEVVQTKQDDPEADQELWDKLRAEILKMTHVEPSERASAADVVQNLMKLKAEQVSFCNQLLLWAGSQSGSCSINGSLPRSVQPKVFSEMQHPSENKWSICLGSVQVLVYSSDAEPELPRGTTHPHSVPLGHQIHYDAQCAARLLGPNHRGGATSLPCLQNLDKDKTVQDQSAAQHLWASDPRDSGNEGGQQGAAGYQLFCMWIHQSSESGDWWIFSGIQTASWLQTSANVWWRWRRDVCFECQWGSAPGLLLRRLQAVSGHPSPQLGFWIELHPWT